MSVYTKGPWEVLPDGFRVYASPCTPEYLKHICHTAHNIRERTEEARANARLIAAAPDLLNAVQEALVLGILPEQTSEERHVLDLMKKAIAKVEGLA